MKVVVRTEYGPPEVVRVEDIAKPTPASNEVLIRVVAASVNGSDREGVIGRPAYSRIGGFRRPRYPILGSDIAGRVEEVGKDVRDLRPGDEVVGEMPGYHSGFAEYVCAPETHLVLKPAALTFAEAAAIPQAGAIAVQGVRIKGKVQPGQKVLINGAGGAAGSFAVQLAKVQGAEVTAVDRAEKHDFLRMLGADHVIDYMREDFAEKRNQYDLILDVVAHRSVFACARALRPNGTYFVAGGAIRVLLGALLFGRLIKRVRRKAVRILIVPQDQQVLHAAVQLCAERTIVAPIDRRYSLEDAPEALRYVSEGQQQGKVVIMFGPETVG
ncbi:MAG: NAD(P)-dependent alcohol dehydrogenase [Gemmatimonadaceae bacterium]